METKEMDKQYDASKVEDQIYKTWEDSGYFNPDKLPGERSEVFSVAMPPPNVTGVLHLGHALENSIMDIAVRYQRMNNKKAVIVPGTDHAAVATQAKVEKLLQEKGIKNPREELGREELLNRIREYADNSRSTILQQIKKMGTSCDWSRLSYTFDEMRSNTVNEIFVRMYNDGLIYRGYRVVNWSVKGQSTCSDDELEHEEAKTTLYTFKYTADFPISISTTRPETKLGDTAVAVHPEDERYKEYIGQTFTVEVGARAPLQIKVIGDESIDKEYGTGAVGVTPAHSMVDYDLYEKHDLELISVIGIDGKMTAEAGEKYHGSTVLEAREKFVEYLKNNDLMDDDQEIDHNVGKSDRFKDVVEVIPMEQWFVAVNKEIPGKGKTLKQIMKEVITTGHNGDENKKIKIQPDRFEKQYFHWIDNLRDWCISRQIWWGHRIPVWYCQDCQEMISAKREPSLCTKCKSQNLTQDEDTLDTWFSSGTWTFSILGWPDETEDFKTFHPISWMQMGYEILFFWMARMILLTTYALDDIPFEKVYIHGMLRDKQGRKFSKSMGTGINPIDVCDKYGTDALRLSLIMGNTPGNDSRFYDEKVESSRNFVNKLWNISRYILMSVKDVKIPNESPKPKTLSDKWILQNLESLKDECTKCLEDYRFSAAAEPLRDFTWSKFADWYIEISKIEGDKDEILLYVLSELLKLWHPFIPFVTENIWSYLSQDNLLIVQKWPKPDKQLQESYEKETVLFEEVIEKIIVAIRNVRTEKKIEPAKLINVKLVTTNHQKLIQDNAEIVKKLARAGELEIVGEKPDQLENAVSVVLKGVEVLIPLEGLMDIEKEIEKMNSEIEKYTSLLNAVNKKLSNQEFVDKAPDAVVAKEQQKIDDYEQIINDLKKNLEDYK